MPTDLAEVICGLAAADQSERERAAREIFQRGVELAHPVVESWFADKELAAVFVPDDSNSPKATVGLAVTPEHFAEIHAAWGSPKLANVPPDQDAMEFELHSGRDVRLDILTTVQPGGTGAIARFLQKAGEGIQQVELLVRDVDRATEILRTTRDLEPIYPQTRPGADQTRVNFFLVATPRGRKLLIELVEPAP
jgi:hypothetical protein